MAYAMDAGDALLAARQLVAAGAWTRWLETMAVGERSARVYIQLARGRALLERQSSAGHLSIAAALRLLSAEGGSSGSQEEQAVQEAVAGV